VIASVLVALGCASAAASAHQRKPAPLVLHPRFHVVGSGPAGVYIDGPYVLLLTPAANFEASGTLIDEQTGTQTSISYPECYLPELNWDPLGGPWLMLSCNRAGQGLFGGGGGFELYNLYTGAWHAVVPDPGIISYGNGCSAGPPYCGVAVAGFGGDWIEWAEHCRYCSDTYLFQNIDTGVVQSLPGWQVGGRVIPDLSSPFLAQTLCAPLTVPAGLPPVPSATPQVGAVSFYGSFAIASSAGLEVLERCGSRLKLAVGSYDARLSHEEPLAANSHAIVWAESANSRRLDGLFLPSLRRFVIATSPSTGPSEVMLSSGELYVVDGNSGMVSATRAPTQNRRPTAANDTTSKSVGERRDRLRFDRIRAVP
jgi:hypothetical protein